MANDLHPDPLTRRTVHLCVGHAAAVLARRPLAHALADRVLPVVIGLASRHAERTVFTRFPRSTRRRRRPGLRTTSDVPRRQKKRVPRG